VRWNWGAKRAKLVALEAKRRRAGPRPPPPPSDSAGSNGRRDSANRKWAAEPEASARELARDYAKVDRSPTMPNDVIANDFCSWPPFAARPWLK